LTIAGPSIELRAEEMRTVSPFWIPLLCQLVVDLEEDARLHLVEASTCWCLVQ
jgi:hypothetical protein